MKENNSEQYHDKTCIWEDNSICITCKIKGKLHCHLSIRLSIYFILSFLTFFIAMLLGLIFANYNLISLTIILIGWFGYMCFFFIIWENRVLCSHCPYYTNEKHRVLHCYANSGILKTSKYRPGPMNLSEKVQFLIGVIILIGYPIPFLIIKEQYIFLTFSIIGIIIWLILMQTKICTICINFSCPLNRVDKKNIDFFLSKNPKMKQAWENSGYKFG